MHTQKGSLKRLISGFLFYEAVGMVQKKIRDGEAP